MKYKNKKRLRNKFIELTYGTHASPVGGNRACLCWDEETYSIECCDGTLRAQGIGSITG